jgi:hypothetical protein
MDHREREKAEMDVDMGIDYRDANAGLSLPLHTNSKALTATIIAGVSSSTIPLSRLLAFYPNTLSNLI